MTSACLRTTTLALTALTAFACSSDPETLECNSSTCGAGFVCVDNTCRELCSDDLDCISGRICGSGDICALGTRQAPIVTDITGRSNQDCTASAQGTTQSEPCIGEGFRVTGTNLDGASFQLQSSGVITNISVPLVVAANGMDQDTVVDLIPDFSGSGLTDLVPDTYLLSATNQQGGAQVGLQLLKGEPGTPGRDLTGQEMVDIINMSETAVIDRTRLDIPEIPVVEITTDTPVAPEAILTALNGNTTGTIDAALIPFQAPVPMTGAEIIDAINMETSATIEDVRVGIAYPGARQYVYDENGLVGEEDVPNNSLNLTITASATTNVSRPVDHARLVELCGDRDGCSISISVSGWQDTANNVEVSAPIPGPECRFFYKDLGGGVGGWSIDESCSQAYRVWAWNGSSFDDATYQPYIDSNAHGLDGAPQSWTPTQSLFVLNRSYACILAEEAPIGGAPNQQQLGNNDQEGFHFFAAHEDWTETYPPQLTGTACTSRGGTVTASGCNIPCPANACGGTNEICDSGACGVLRFPAANWQGALFPSRTRTCGLTIND